MQHRGCAFASRGAGLLEKQIDTVQPAAAHSCPDCSGLQPPCTIKPPLIDPRRMELRMAFRSLTRRHLLKTGTLASLSFAAQRSAYAKVVAPASAVPTPTLLRQLDYNQVALLPGPMRRQFDQTHQRFMGIDNDMLLKPFREAAGLPAPGDDMGGWYSHSRFFNVIYGADGFVPGHSFGQYLSGLSRAYAITGSRATQAKVEQLVAGLQPTLVSRFYDGYHLPGYTFDKLCCGLIDASSYAEVASAMPAAEQALAAALPHLPEKALSRYEQRARPHTLDADTWDETYTLPENLFLAYQRSGRPAFRDAAVRFLEDDTVFNPLAEDVNVLAGEHAYSHVNALSSAMQAYLTMGSEKHLRAARNGFAMVEAQSFATGGWGPAELLQRPNTDDLARSIFKEVNHFETPCGAYAHFKITRYLLRVTGDSRYGDSMERVLYNTVLGVKPILEDGSSFYYSDYSTSGRKTYHHDRWPCCSGTLPQIAADYGISSYLQSKDGLHVILYVPSKVTWREGGVPVTLTQETAYPLRPTTRLTIGVGTTREFTLNLRIPAWAGAGTRVLVGGKATEAEVRPGTFFPLRRAWRNGDVVEIEFAMPLRLETLDLKEPTRTTQLAALMAGPVVFMATGPWPIEIERDRLLSAAKVSGGDAYSITFDKVPVVFKPFTAIDDEVYRTYQMLRA